MKTQLVYGFAIALAGLLLQVLLTLAGLYSDPSKLGMAQGIATILGLAISIGGTYFGIRACRSAVPADQAYPYGRAFSAGFGITLYTAILGIFTTLLFFNVIDRNVREVMLQAQIDKMTAKGIDAEKAESLMRTMMSTPVLLITAFFSVLIMGTLISLIVAAFLRREASRPTLEAATPS